MKYLLPLIVAFSVVALAGDDWVYTMSFPVAFDAGIAPPDGSIRYDAGVAPDGGARAACYNGSPFARYAIRCEMDSYVRVRTPTTRFPTDEDVLIPSDRLYDTPTSSGQSQVCFLPRSKAVDGGFGRCFIYINRSHLE